MTRPAMVTDFEQASPCSTHDVRVPPSAATDSHLHEAARFVISPDGHADDARLQVAFKLLRTEAPVFWVDTPGMRPFWLLSRYGDISAVERRSAPFTAAPRTFLTSKKTEERLERLLGKPYVIRGLLQMDEPEHAAYRAVAQPSLTPGALAAMEP
jgi:cytochrome P450